MTDLASRVSYRLVTPSELAQVFKLETLAFSPDEAATESKLALRLSEANDLFLGLYLASAAATAAEPELIGFICATLSPTSTLSHDSMSTHDPAAAYIAIHSVCVTPTYQRRGLASQLLAKYVEWVRKLNQQRRGGIKGIRLIAHDYLIGFYERGGFVNRGKSQVVHGEGEWFEIGLDFDNAVEEEREESVRSPGARFETKPMSEWVDESGTNKVDIFCPRGECRCLLLRKGVGRWVQNDGQFKLPALSHLIASPPASTISSTSFPGYWSVASPLAFENIGFSRNAAPPSTSTTAATSNAAGTTIKYLICADCDQGPLGWHDTEGRDLGLEVEAENEANTTRIEGTGEVRKGREFLLDVERLRYRLG